MIKLPGLYGIRKSNRDFSRAINWGKNQFNSSFPVSLASYMHSIQLEPVYLALRYDLAVAHDKISVATLFGIDPINYLVLKEDLMLSL